jgi:hypothetical protein
VEPSLPYSFSCHPSLHPFALGLALDLEEFVHRYLAMGYFVVKNIIISDISDIYAIYIIFSILISWFTVFMLWIGNAVIAVSRWYNLTGRLAWTTCKLSIFNLLTVETPSLIECIEWEMVGVGSQHSQSIQSVATKNNEIHDVILLHIISSLNHNTSISPYIHVCVVFYSLFQLGYKRNQLTKQLFVPYIHI